jgi:transcription-repair coupling factor (superfamily II helicase)
LNNFFEKINFIAKNHVISGVGDGEKVILSNCSNRLIFLSNNFVSAGKIKRGLEGLGKKAEIISNARESADANDRNLLPMIEKINGYIAGEIDALIILPCSAIVKFDIKKLTPIIVKAGEERSLSNLIENLVVIGYERSSLASEKGQFAVRGDILDIFSPINDHPIRIEFFDDIIEKISIFDETTMKNIEKIDEFKIFTAFLPIGEDCFFDLDGTKIIDEPKKINDEIELLIKSYETTSFYNQNLYQSFDYLLEKADIVFDNFNVLNTGYHNESIAQRSYLTDFLALKQDIYDYKNLNQSIILFAGEERFKTNLEGFLTENGIAYNDFDFQTELTQGSVYISKLPVPYSFSFLREGVTAVGCDSLFRTNTSTFSKSKHSTFYLPKIGEYVVHTFHGIGKCIGIERLKISDIEKDYFVIEYKKGDKLYLPSEEANTLSAYVGSEETPRVSSLGGAEFSRLKDRVRASIKEMALSLVEIYRERQHVKGFKFERDELLEKQFADAFGYQETIDQLKAIEDVDNDMESDKVMDRLICGDVGFGKTEVALRGAFKCIYNGKQVALLCPTTILSEQHYRTAKERLEPFGGRVEVINRFKTTQQINEILKRVQAGEVDMLIGTHRLLSSDVIFKDLGLLILDEEQRFGVEHKEKIKDARRNVDVLTLSATPIPRTLNMSLSGIRDISIIETPPRERLPIQTYLAEESDELIKDVLSRELARGGQAFVVYNRVESIEEFASYLRKLLPLANIGVAHGQMNERVLENVIARLFNNEYNILVSTTLIENGINLPSANTMVVIDSDRLGLSQLYQLRGRIGRSDKLSYAYLTYNKDKTLTDEAYKRLEAIKQFTSLGSGFKIAMRDLELRGAGNIFGKEQHGHIAKVGYDMFVKLLEEEVKEIKGEKIKKQSDVKLEVNLSAFISEDYIEEGEQRIVYYSQISEISSAEQMTEILESMKDGYGEVPEEVTNLCKLALLRNLAGEYGVKKIIINKLESIVVLEKKENIIDPRLADAMTKFNAKLGYDNFVKIKFDANGTILKRLEKMITFFESAK